MEVGLEQTKCYETNYPENLRRIFVINGIFYIIFLCLHHKILNGFLF